MARQDKNRDRENRNPRGIGPIVTCPKCTTKTLSGSAQSCPNCGEPFVKRPRVEVVPSLPAEGVSAAAGLSPSESRIFDSPVLDADRTLEKAIEAQWTRIEKVSRSRIFLSRISRHLAKPSAGRSSNPPGVAASEPRQEKLHHANGPAEEIGDGKSSVSVNGAALAAAAEPHQEKSHDLNGLAEELGHAGSSVPTSIAPQESHPPGGTILVVNLAQVVTCDCAICGGGFASTPTGARLLLAKVAEMASYPICANCGGRIMSHVHSDEAAKRYEWDWAIPLRRGEPGSH